MSGLDRAGYKQISHNTDCVVITSTMSAAATTCPYDEGWCGFKVISSQAAVATVTDAGMTGSSLISSGSSLPNNAEVWGQKITALKLSADSTGHKIIAYRKVLL